MATDRTMFTGLDKESWETGLKWARANKQPGLTLLVIDMGLDVTHVSKLQELGVKVFPNTNKTGVNQVDVFNSFLASCNNQIPGTYLFWDMEVKTESVSPMWGSSRFVSPLFKDPNIATLVFPLTTIDSRVKIGRTLEKQEDIHYSGLMSGGMYDWKLFIGLYNTMVETGVVETLISSRNLVLNLFALYFHEHVEIKPVEYEISALQLENQE